MTDRYVIDSINKKLLEEWRVLDGRPIYRIVWSYDQLEKRFSDKWTDWYGHVLIRENVKAVREIKKYWYIKPHCWVMEKLIFMQSHYHLKEMMKELVESQNGTYESIFTFYHDKQKIHLPVIETIVDQIIQQLHNPTRRSTTDWDKVRQVEEASEVEYFEDQLSQGERSPLFVADNAAFISTNQMRFVDHRRLKQKQELTYTEPSGPIVLAGE